MNTMQRKEIMDRKRRCDYKRINCLFLMLIIYPVNNLLMALYEYMGIQQPNSLIFLYFIVFLYGTTVVFRFSFTKKDLSILLFIYICYLFLYLCSEPEARIEFKSVYMKIVYFYFIPFSVILISHIENWEEYFTNKKYIYFADIMVIFTIISKLFLHDSTDYMIFSYDLLPLWGIVIVSALHYHNKKQWIFVMVIIIEALVFGSRGAFLWLVICGMLTYFVDFYYLIGNKKKFFNRLLSIPCILGIVVLAIVIFLPKLMESSLSSSSYILKRISMGNLGESKARIDIINICMDAIKDMGSDIHGLFYDRLIIPKGMYAHNIIIEAILCLGWVLGILFLFFVFYKTFKAFKSQTHQGKIVFSYFFSLLFLRYFISGSIFGEGKFIIFIAVMVSLCRKKVKIQTSIKRH